MASHFLGGQGGTFSQGMFWVCPWLCCAILPAPSQVFSHVQFEYISGEHFWKNALIFKGLEEPLIRGKYCMNDPFEKKVLWTVVRNIFFPLVFNGSCMGTS